MAKLTRAQRSLSTIRLDQKAWQAGQPRRCKTNIVGAAGECLACDAEQGVCCQFAVTEAGRDASAKEPRT